MLAHVRVAFRVVAASGCLLAVPSAVQAKCAPASYHLVIQAVDAETGANVTGARVMLFADGGTLELSQNRPEPVVATDGNGQLAATYWFNTFSGMSLFGGHRCEARIKTLDVVVLHADYVALRVRVSQPGLRRRPMARWIEYDVDVPTIRVVRRPPAAD